MKKIGLALLIAFFIGCSNQKIDNATFAILPLGLDKTEFYLIADIEKSIKENPNFKVVILPESNLPKSAWYEPRQRYHANKILTHLKKIKPVSADYIIAITSADISIIKNTNDWGIFGLGNEPGTASVISSFRLGKNKKLLTRRILKLTKHELGHNFGLAHCTNSKTCIMNSIESSIKTVDRVSKIYCKKCKEKLRN